MSQPIVFIGSSAPGLSLLSRHPGFGLQGALCLSDRITPALRAATDAAGVDFVAFNGSVGLREATAGFAENLPFFIYQLDMLVPAELALSRGFYNVHRGNMLSNRGPTPDIWPILDGEPVSTISLHRIDDKVDAGWLIDAVDVELTTQDDPCTVCARMELQLPRLLDSLAEHLRGQRPSLRLSGGRYRPWVTEADFSIDPARDSAEQMDRKIRSQRPYNGALLWQGTQRHYVLELLSFERVSEAADAFVLDGDRMHVCAAGRRLEFRCNPVPKYPPPPVRQPSRRI